VPVEFVCGQNIQLFVVRVAGNVTLAEIIASVEYRAAVLGTKVLMVLGHSNGGAVKATIEAKAVPGQIKRAIRADPAPAVDAAGDNLDAAIDANAKDPREPAQRGIHYDRRRNQGRQGSRWCQRATTWPAGKYRCWRRRALFVSVRPVLSTAGIGPPESRLGV
jgi:hypothetical protein